MPSKIKNKSQTAPPSKDDNPLAGDWEIRLAVLIGRNQGNAGPPKGDDVAKLAAILLETLQSPHFDEDTLKMDYLV